MYCNVLKLFVALFACFLLIECVEAKYILINDFLKESTISSSITQDTKQGSIIRAPCKAGYMYILRKCRRVLS